MIRRQQFGDRPHGNHYAIRQHGDTIADFIQRIEIVRDEEDRQPQRVGQFAGQAVETGRPVLPLAISYHDAAGGHTLGPAFVGEATLIDSFAAILASRALIVHLSPSPAIDTNGKSRRDVVRAAHEAIASALTTRLGFPLSSTAPGKQPDPPA